MTKSPDEYESAQCGGPYCRPWRPALSKKMQAPLPAPPAEPAVCVGSVRGLFWRASQCTGICIPRPAARKREIAVQTEARHHCTLLVRGPIRPVCPVFEAKAFSRDTSARQNRRFPQLSLLPLKNNRLDALRFQAIFMRFGLLPRAYRAAWRLYSF